MESPRQDESFFRLKTIKLFIKFPKGIFANVSNVITDLVQGSDIQWSSTPQDFPLSDREWSY